MILSQHGQTAARSRTFLDRFDCVAKQTEDLTGHPFAFGDAVGFMAIWAMTGPLFHCGDSWQVTLVAVDLRCDLSDGVLNSKHPEPHACRAAIQTR
jgi:hypothetical protein